MKEEIYGIAGVLLALGVVWFIMNRGTFLSSGKPYVADPAYDQAGY